MIGVTFNKQTRKWRATLRGYGRNGYIGEYSIKEDAMNARRQAEIEIHGTEHSPDQAVEQDGVLYVPIFGRKGRRIDTALVDASDRLLIGDSRWCKTASGYPVQRRGVKIVYMHRVIYPDCEVCDHSNGNKMDNRRCNLRPCSLAENARNRSVLNKNNTSGARGVTKTPSGRWRARIWKNRKEYYIGAFATREEAMVAYEQKAKELHGAFASIPGVSVEVWS